MHHINQNIDQKIRTQLQYIRFYAVDKMGISIVFDGLCILKLISSNLIGFSTVSEVPDGHFPSLVPP